MSKKHYLLKTAAASMTALFAVNTAIDYHAKEKNLCSTTKGSFYHWKHGDIYYTVQGEGSPLLLIHNLDTISSGYEWSRIVKKLEKNHRVYVIDLLGCGRSDKPSLTYTNYLYVQMITNFIQDVIGNRTSIVTSADSSSIAIMTNKMNPEIIEHIILFNPTDPAQLKMETTQIQLAIKDILFLPVIGTVLYNFYVSEENIKRLFQKKYFSRTIPDEKKYQNIYYQTAHINKSNGRFLYASKKCSYTNADVSIAITDKENIHIIQSSDCKKSISIAEEYVKLSSGIDITYISNTKLLPMLEAPEQSIKIIENYLK